MRKIVFLIMVVSLICLFGTARGESPKQIAPVLQLQVPDRRVVAVKKSFFKTPDSYIHVAKITNPGSSPRSVEVEASLVTHEDANLVPGASLSVSPSTTTIYPGQTKEFRIEIPAKWGQGVLFGFSYKPVLVSSVLVGGQVGIEIGQGYLAGVNFGVVEEPLIEFKACQKSNPDRVETLVVNKSPWVIQCAVIFSLEAKGDELSFMVGSQSRKAISFPGVHSVAVLDVRGLGKRVGVKLSGATDSCLLQP